MDVLVLSNLAVGVFVLLLAVTWRRPARPLVTIAGLAASFALVLWLQATPGLGRSVAVSVWAGLQLFVFAKYSRAIVRHAPIEASLLVVVIAAIAASAFMAESTSPAVRNGVVNIAGLSFAALLATMTVRAILLVRTPSTDR